MRFIWVFSTPLVDKHVYRNMDLHAGDYTHLTTFIVLVHIWHVVHAGDERNNLSILPDSQASSWISYFIQQQRELVSRADIDTPISVHILIVWWTMPMRFTHMGGGWYNFSVSTCSLRVINSVYGDMESILTMYCYLSFRLAVCGCWTVIET